VFVRAGYASHKFVFDSDGNQIEESYFDPVGKPVSNEEGVARFVWKYDQRGLPIESLHCGPNGKPTLSKHGRARVVRTFSTESLMIEEFGCGIDGEPSIHDDGSFRSTTEYDDGGFPKKRLCFGPSGKLVLNKLGYAQASAVLDHRGNELETRFLDAAG